MLFAICQYCFCFFLIDQIESKMGGDVAKRERHQGSLLQAVVDAARVGIDNVVGQSNLSDLIRLSSFQLFATKLEAHQGCQMEQIGVRDLGADERAKRCGSRSVGNCQLDLFEPLSRRTWQRSWHFCFTSLRPSNLNVEVRPDYVMTWDRRAKLERKA
jgi:hypothetical protein